MAVVAALAASGTAVGPAPGQALPAGEGTAGARGAPGGAALCLQVRVYPAGHALFEVGLEEPEFAVTFRHSVEKTLVVERFLVRQGAGGFTLYRTEYLSFGAGLPTDGKLELQPQGPVVVMALERSIPRLVFRVSRMTEHSLEAGGYWLDLSGAVPDGTAVELVAFDCKAAVLSCGSEDGGSVDGQQHN